MNEILAKKSYEDITYSEIGYNYYTKSDYKIYIPLIVIDQNSFLEVRDCYLRSIIKEQGVNDVTSNIPRQYFSVHEVCFYLCGEPLEAN